MIRNKTYSYKNLEQLMVQLNDEVINWNLEQFIVWCNLKILYLYNPRQVMPCENWDKSSIIIIGREINLWRIHTINLGRTSRMRFFPIVDQACVEWCMWCAWVVLDRCVPSMLDHSRPCLMCGHHGCPLKFLYDICQCSWYFF